MYYIYISPIAQSGFLEIKMFPLFNFDSFQIKEEVFNKWPLFSTSNVTYITLLNWFFLEYSTGMCQSLKIWGGAQKCGTPPAAAVPSDLPKSGRAYAPLASPFDNTCSIFKTKQLSRVLVTLLVLNECLNGLVLRSLTSPECIYNSHYSNGVPQYLPLSVVQLKGIHCQ